MHSKSADALENDLNLENLVGLLKDTPKIFIFGGYLTTFKSYYSNVPHSEGLRSRDNNIK